MSSKLLHDAGGRVTRAELYRTGTLQNKITAAYNLRGWLTSEARTVDGALYTLGYGYNDAGDRIEMTYPGGTALSLKTATWAGWSGSPATSGLKGSRSRMDSYTTPTAF